MSKLVKETAPLRSIYFVKLRNLVEEPEPSGGEDINAKIDILLNNLYVQYKGIKRMILRSMLRFVQTLRRTWPGRGDKTGRIWTVSLFHSTHFHLVECFCF